MTRKPCYCKDDRTARYALYMDALKKFWESLAMPVATFPEIN